MQLFSCGLYHLNDRGGESNGDRKRHNHRDQFAPTYGNLENHANGKGVYGLILNQNTNLTIQQRAASHDREFGE